MRTSLFYFTYEDAIILMSGTTTRQKSIILNKKQNAVERARKRMKTELYSQETIKEFKRLVLSGYSVHHIIEKLNIKDSVAAVWFDRVVKEKYLGRENVFFGSKDEAYFPSDEFSEEECWSMPSYSLEDLSEEELNLLNSPIHKAYEEELVGNYREDPDQPTPEEKYYELNSPPNKKS